MQLARKFEETTKNVTLLRVSTNFFADTKLSVMPPSPDDLSDEGLVYFGCLFHALFQPSPALQQAVKDETTRVFGRALGADEKYVAAHIRMGGLTGEEKHIPRLGADPMTLVCIADLLYVY